MPCNLNLDFSALGDKLLSQVGTLLNFKEFVGTVPGLAGIQAALAGALATIKGGLSGILPDVPFASDLISLRDKLGDFANKIDTDLGKLLGDFGGINDLIGLSGTINLNDLASSAINLALNFDPCSIASGIPNVFSDGAGNLLSKPSQQPNQGFVNFGTAIAQARQTFTDPVKTLTQQVGFTDVNSIVSSVVPTDVSKAMTALSGATVPSLSGLGNVIKVARNGEKSFQNATSFLDEIKARISPLEEMNRKGKAAMEQLNKIRAGEISQLV